MSSMEEKEFLYNHLQKWDREIDDARRCYGIKICLGGAEKEKIRDGLYRIGVRKISVSYFYLRNWLKKHGVQSIGEEFGKFDYVYLSSGCNSILDKNKDSKVKIDAKKYSEEYYNDLRRIGHIFAGCSEIDFPPSTGINRDYLDSKLEEMVDEGIPIVPVIKGEALKYYEDLGWFDNYAYLGISSEITQDKKYAGYMNDLYRLCRERGVLLHGLGVSSADVLFRSRLYSISTSTWSTGAKFGMTHIFENGRIKYYQADRKDVRLKYKNKFEEAGLDWDAIASERTFEVSMMNALAWNQLASYHQYRAPNAYWLTREEKDRANLLKAKSVEGMVDKEASLVRTQERRLALVDDPDEDGRVHEPLQCNVCSIAENCPRCEPGASCSYDLNVRLQTTGDYHRMMKVLIEAQYARAMNGFLFEKIAGGALDKNVSSEMQRLMDMMAQMKTIFTNKQTRSLSGDKLSIHAETSKPGTFRNLMAQVFSPTGVHGSGSGNTEVERTARTIDIDPDGIDSMDDSEYDE